MGGRLLSVCAIATCTGVLNTLGTRSSTNQLGPGPGSTSPCHVGTSGEGVNLRFDAPLFDSTAGRLYIFVGNDGDGNSAVVQVPSTLTNNTCGTEAVVGTGSTAGTPAFIGAFDDVYFTSSSSSPTGDLYVCGNTGGDATLYQIPITADTMSTSSTAVLTVSSAATTCSGVTEFVDGTGTDRAFFSVQSNGSTAGNIGCPSGGGGCVISVDLPLTSGGALPSGANAALGASGGTSDIVIDNSVVPGALTTSQCYFSTLVGGTAIQASQAAFQ